MCLQLWRSFVPYANYGLSSNAHATLCYTHIFESYQALHSFNLATEACLRGVKNRQIWGQLVMSGTGRALKIGRRSELYAILRMLQPKDGDDFADLHISINEQ